MFNAHRNIIRATRSALFLALATGACADFEDDELDLEEDVGQTVVALQDTMTSPGQNGFAPKYRAHSYFCLGGEDCQVGDFNGDGRDDIVTFVPANGQVWVATSDGNSFVNNRTWRTGFANRDSYYDIGDINGDRRDDIVRFTRSSGDVHVSYSTGAGFRAPRLLRSGVCVGEVECRVGKVDADRFADIVKFVGTAEPTRANQIHVARGRRTRIDAPVRWGRNMCSDPTSCQLGDINGDDLDDVVQFTKRRGGGIVLVASSTGSAFRNPLNLRNAFCDVGETCALGDVNGSGRADLVSFQRRHNGSDFPRPDQADVLTSLSRWAPTTTQASFGSARIRTEEFCINARVCKLADVNGDGKDDLISFTRDESSAFFGDVFVARSTFGQTTNWRMDHDWLRALAVEGSADQPYLIALSFRATFGERGSTTIVRNSFRNTAWAHRIRRGERRAIPAWEGEHVFRNVRLPTFAELMLPSPPPLEVLGTLVIAMEHDWTPWHEIDAIVDRVEDELDAVLYDTVERTAPGLLILDQNGFREKINDATTSLRDSMELDLAEKIRLALVSGFDPDDYIDYHLYLYPAVDKEATDLLPAIGGTKVDLGVPGDGWGGYWPTSNDFIDSDGPIRWRVTSQMELVP